MKKELKKKVLLRGIRPIMFDRYAGDNKTELPPERKMYFAADGETLMLPAANVMSLLTSQNTISAPKRFLDSRKYKSIAGAFLSYVTVSPWEIPFICDGKPFKFTGFVDEVGGEHGVYIHRSVARLDKGIPNPKVRPVLKLPWSLEFELIVLPNTEFNEDMLYNMLEKGMLAIGLGTYRGVYGKAVIETWETI